MPDQSRLMRRDRSLTSQRYASRRAALLLAFLALTLAITLALPGGAQPAFAQGGDDVISRVNEEPITRSAFTRRVRFVRWQYVNQLIKLYDLTSGNISLAESYAGDLIAQLLDPPTLGDSVLGQLEEEILITQTTADREIVITEEDITRRKMAFFSAWTGVDASEIPEDAGAQAFIETWYADAMTVSGMSRAEIDAIFEAETRRDLLYQYLSASLPTEELSINSRHILCSFHPDAPAQIAPPTETEQAAAEVCIAEAQARLAAGEPFEDVAADLSDDRLVDAATGQEYGSASQGGNLGWISESYLAKAYADAAAEAPVGEVIGPVTTEYGLHLIEVLDRQMEPLSAEEIDANRVGYFNLWLDTLLADAAITRSEGWDADIPTEPGLDGLAPGIQQALELIGRAQ